MIFAVDWVLINNYLSIYVWYHKQITEEQHSTNAIGKTKTGKVASRTCFKTILFIELAIQIFTQRTEMNELCWQSVLMYVHSEAVQTASRMKSRTRKKTLCYY